MSGGTTIGAIALGLVAAVRVADCGGPAPGTPDSGREVVGRGPAFLEVSGEELTSETAAVRQAWVSFGEVRAVGDLERGPIATFELYGVDATDRGFAVNPEAEVGTYDGLMMDVSRLELEIEEAGRLPLHVVMEKTVEVAQKCDPPTPLWVDGRIRFHLRLHLQPLYEALKDADLPEDELVDLSGEEYSEVADRLAGALEDAWSLDCEAPNRDAGGG